MDIIFYIYLFLFGSIFGSFASVIIYRLKNNEKGIMLGRSHCGSCNTFLKIPDLIPLLSWVLRKGKCHYCGAKVSSIYFFLELCMGLLFVAVGYFLLDFNLLLAYDAIEIGKMFFWLFVVFISVVYTFYDILFLEIHDGVMGIGVAGVVLVLIIESIGKNIGFTPHMMIEIPSMSIMVYGILLAMGILIGLYAIIFKELHELWDSLILVFSGVSIALFLKYSGSSLTDFPLLDGVTTALAIFIFFFLQIVISKGAWLGGGDLRIAIFIGLIVGTQFGFAMMMLAYLAGSILGIGAIVCGKIRFGWKHHMQSQVPFGPFLAIGFFLTIFFQTQIQNVIEIYFYNM